MLRPGLREVSAIFVRVGNLTFGGGDPTMAALQREFVSNRRWLSEDQSGLALSLARVTPGTNVLAFCAACGYMMRGMAGAVLGVVGACALAAAAAVLLIAFSQSWLENPWGRAVFGSMAAGVAGIMLASVYLLVAPRMRQSGWFRPAVIAGAGFLLSFWLDWPPILIIAMAAIAGFLWKEPDEA